MKPKILVYVNSHAAHFLTNPVLKRYLTKKLGSKSWIHCGDVLVPELLRENHDYMTENFFHGVSAQQFTMIHDGGTFINPMLYGLNSDFDLWNDILHDTPDFYQEILYVDIPYEVYGEIGKDDDYFVNEETYSEMSMMIEKMVNSIKNTYYPTAEVVH